jgi:endonuclease G
MSGTSGKVLLTLPGIAPGAVACPTGTGIVDHVGYGTASNCASEWGGVTANVSSSTAAFRKNDGCIKTGSVASDFIVLAPNPHNSGSAIKHCDGEPPRPQSSATIVINELMADPANAESASWGEWFEVHNYGTAPINLKGWTIVSGGTSQPNHTIVTDVIVAPGDFAVLGRGADGERNGGVTLDYNYFVGGGTTIWLDDSDYLMLVDADGARADSVAWTGVSHGVTRALRNAALPHADVNGTNWGYSTTVFGDGDYGTPDAANGTLADVAPIVSANKITVTGRISTDAPLPVGFESQVFASEATAGGVAIPTTFTWTALTPGIATIDQRGVIHAVAAGSARFQVTAEDGTSRIHTLSMVTPVASSTAQYLDNAAFGEPTDDNPSDDFIIHRPQYTTSFNGSRGIPNWVAYDLNGTDIVSGQDRCNCFTFDPELIAAGFTRYTTADYTGAGAFAGFGIDRGHMTRSFDRTAGTLDNARTYYFSNVVPQFADLNQGPWANMEIYLGDLAQFSNKEVYIYVGPAGSIGTVKNEGKITIPKYTWKIALIMPRGEGLADVHDYRDVDVIAAVMPNMPGIHDVNWQTNYMVTADSVEKLTGYHFLSLLSARTQRALKTGTKPPLGSVNGPFSSSEGTAVSMSAAASLDPNGTITSYAWKFGDGGVASGPSVSHTYARYGSYTVSMVVTDNDGLVDTVSTSTSVANVAPAVLAFDGATLLPGETYSSTGSFADPGVDPWSATVDYGDGSGPNALLLADKTFSLSHTYAAAGTFPVTVTVFDGDATSTNTQTVTVISRTQGVSTLSDMVNQLIARGILSAGSGSSLRSKLDAASNQLTLGNGPAAANQLRAFSNEVNALVNAGRLGSAQAKELTSLASRIIVSVRN